MIGSHLPGMHGIATRASGYFSDKQVVYYAGTYGMHLNCMRRDGRDGRDGLAISIKVSLGRSVLA